LASSFLKKGIREVAIEIHCSDETSIKSIFSFEIIPGSPFILASTLSGKILFFLSMEMPPAAILYFSS